MLQQQQKLINELSPEETATAINLECRHGFGVFAFAFTTSAFLFKNLCSLFFCILSKENTSKIMKMLLVDLKKVFSFSRCSNFCNFLPSFLHFSDSTGQIQPQ